MPFVIALDEGTTSARAALYNEEGRRVAAQSEPIECFYPQPGWVEQDAEAIWRAQLDATRRTLAAANISAREIAAVGIANQRETTIVWDKNTGRPVAPAIVWQCRRTAAYCDALAQREMVRRKTGLVIDAYFSASKIRWLLDHAGASPRDLLFGNVDTWLIWKLTGGTHVTDPTNASRTMLMNLESGDWDDELLNLFGIPGEMMPRIVASSGVCGTALAEHLGAEIPIAGIAGDQQAALFGQACFSPGLSKNTYGTGCFALMHAGAHAPVSRHRLLATRAASPDRTAQYAVEGSIFIAGAAVQWLRDKLQLISTAAESEALAASVPDTGGAYLVPAFVGLGAPYWDSSARGLFTGITATTDRARLVRATLESIAYQTRDLVDAMEADAGQKIKELRVDGGATANNFLMQFQADILGCPIVRPADTETTALGAAYLAGLATGYFKNMEELSRFWRSERVFQPQMPVDRREELWAGWKRAVAQCRFVGSEQARKTSP
ncbi:MAG TPA: glycerol kinase GlpK [Bryobacteraceae bacterium]|nr:glycerol kinase GlpK [Bryobacteraceae bacterium]